MTTARAVPAAGVAVGLGSAAIAGAVLAGPWWAVAVVAGAGAVSGRNGSLVQAVATVGLVGGAVAADATWLVPILVGGVVATAEAGVVPEHVTRVRRRVNAGPALAASLAAAATATAILVLGNGGAGPGIPAALVAAGAAVALLASLRS